MRLSSLKWLETGEIIQQIAFENYSGQLQSGASFLCQTGDQKLNIMGLDWLSVALASLSFLHLCDFTVSAIYSSHCMNGFRPCVDVCAKMSLRCWEADFWCYRSPQRAMYKIVQMLPIDLENEVKVWRSRNCMWLCLRRFSMLNQNVQRSQLVTSFPAGVRGWRSLKLFSRNSTRSCQRRHFRPFLDRTHCGVVVVVVVFVRHKVRQSYISRTV